jgi:S-DNA-T family DNA segregation ATPase FtsK/SpoIIIE
MAKKDLKTKEVSRDSKKEKVSEKLSTPTMNPRVKSIILAIILLAVVIVIVLGAFGAAGVAGNFLYEKILKFLFGFGVILVPILLIIYAMHLIRDRDVNWSWLEATSSIGLLFSILGFIEIVSPGVRAGGLVGYGIGSLATKIFDVYAGATVLGALALISAIVLLNEELGIPEFLKNLFTKKDISNDIDDATLGLEDLEDEDPEPQIITLSKEELNAPIPELKEESKPIQITKKEAEDEFIVGNATFSETYEYPPIDLLGKSSGKPSVGDIKANANLIKRTLLNFGIDVEMDEVSIGPTVTRYALKPAEGIKLTRILALKSDLALALAAHPIRIEAPIPGKSLVGIEIPNKTKANVGLGSLLEEPAFENSPNRLMVALGKGVTGKSFFANLGKMPHLLIAGTTGSGKSVTVHNLILSLLYRNGPEDLRLIMVDPKRVELTLYNNIPHLLTPVIKEPKKAILALKWAAKEMERRYDLLEKHACRDIESYRKKIEGKKDAEKMPFIVIFIDELGRYYASLSSGARIRHCSTCADVTSCRYSPCPFNPTSIGKCYYGTYQGKHPITTRSSGCLTN